MEIETCEQYVLDQLKCTENEVYSLRAAIDEWKARCAKLEAELRARDERDASEVEQAIIKEGRAKLYRNGSSYRTSVDGGGKLMPFEDWCIEHTGYPSQRCGMTKTEFIAYFEPEFRAEYEELAEEWKAEQE